MKSWKKWGEMGKSGEKWRKVGKGGEKWGKVGIKGPWASVGPLSSCFIEVMHNEF